MEQLAQSEQVDDVLRFDHARSGARQAKAVEQIGFDVQVREQQIVLEHVAQSPLLGRQIDAPCAIEKRFTVDDDVAALRMRGAGERVDDTGLA